MLRLLLPLLLRTLAHAASKDFDDSYAHEICNVPSPPAPEVMRLCTEITRQEALFRDELERMGIGQGSEVGPKHPQYARVRSAGALADLRTQKLMVELAEAVGDGERHALLEERLEEMRKLEQIASAGYPSDAPKTPKKRTTKRSGTRRNEKVRKRKPRRELRSSWD